MLASRSGMDFEASITENAFKLSDMFVNFNIYSFMPTPPAEEVQGYDQKLWNGYDEDHVERTAVSKVKDEISISDSSLFVFLFCFLNKFCLNQSEERRKSVPVKVGRC